MSALVNNRVRITMNDSRAIVGQLLAYDKYMNLVVADAEEFRRVKNGKNADGTEKPVIRRPLGLLVLRGETIVSCSLETGAPSSGFENKARTTAAQQMQPGMRAVPGAPSSMIPPPMMPAQASMMMRPGMMMMPPGMMRPPSNQ